MKAFLLNLTLIFIVSIATAQESNYCISIIETNLNELVTNVEEINKLDDKIIISSLSDGEKYFLLISLSNTTEFMKHITVGAKIRLVTREKDGKRYLSVSKEENGRVLLKIFLVCGQKI